MRAITCFCAALLLLSKAAVAQGPSPTRWAVDAGWGVRFWDNAGQSADEKKYFQQARTGEVYGLEVSAHPWKHAGIGLSLSMFAASAHEANMTFQDQSQGRAKDEFRIVYLAPTAYLARELGERVRLLGSAGAGWIFYRNESRAGAFPGVLEGTAPGLHAAAAADFLLSPRFGVGFGVRAIHGELERIRYNAISTSYGTISLTRVDFIAGIRIYP